MNGKDGNSGKSGENGNDNGNVLKYTVHGNMQCYNKGCRCALCKRANTLHVSMQRSKRNLLRERAASPMLNTSQPDTNSDAVEALKLELTKLGYDISLFTFTPESLTVFLPGGNYIYRSIKVTLPNQRIFTSDARLTYLLPKVAAQEINALLAKQPSLEKGISRS